jgi:hypothetical protein
VRRVASKSRETKKREVKHPIVSADAMDRGAVMTRLLQGLTGGRLAGNCEAIMDKQWTAIDPAGPSGAGRIAIVRSHGPQGPPGCLVL